MAIEIVPHAEQYRPAVEAFNLRMRAGGSPWGMYPDPVPDWIPKQRADQRVWREYYLALEDGAHVRGGFALKPQAWLIGGTTQLVTDWQGPFSEGAIARKYAALGLRMLRDMLRRRPLLYSWGHGQGEQMLLQMLPGLGFTLHATPLCLRVLEPYRFLRRNGMLRRDRARRVLLDALACSGLGPLALRALALGCALARGVSYRAHAELVADFGAWADALWARCAPRYAALAVRDREAMNALLPPGKWPPGLRLRVRDDRGADLGWAVVMDTAMRGDRRFGDLRVGSIVDALAQPEDAGRVIAAATRFLAARGVDLIVSNQAHPSWIDGFRQSSYVVLHGRRLFAASPELQKALSPFAHTARGLHLTNLDGHGPMAL